MPQAKIKTPDLKITVGKNSKILPTRILHALALIHGDYVHNHLTVELSIRSKVPHISIATDASKVSYKIPGKLLFHKPYIDEINTVIAIEGKVLDVIGKYIEKVKLYLSVATLEDSIEQLVKKEFSKWKPTFSGTHGVHLELDNEVSVYMSPTIEPVVSYPGKTFKTVDEAIKYYPHIAEVSRKEVSIIKTLYQTNQFKWQGLVKELDKAQYNFEVAKKC